MELDETPASNPYSLMGIVAARFRESFGDPNMTSFNHQQWTLKTAPFARDIYVLLGGKENQPMVWLFDSNDRNDGVSCSVIEREEGIVEIIDHARDRITRASRTQRKPRDVMD